MQKKVLSILITFLLIVPIGSVFADSDALLSPSPSSESATPTLEVSPTPTPVVSPTPTPTPEVTPTPTPTPTPSPTPTPTPTPTPSPEVSDFPVSMTELNQYAVHSVTLVADTASPQAASTAILLTAIIANGDDYEFRFESQRGDRDWTVMQAWGASNTYTWKPLVYGSYTLRVSVRPKGGSIASRSDLFYSITSQPWKDFSGADAISAGTPINAALSVVGEQDMYRFTVPMDGTYIIGTTGGTDTFGALFDNAGTLIKENDNGNDSNFMITSEMASGSIYYIGVRHADAGTGAYTLSVGRQAEPVKSVTLHATPDSSCEYNTPVQLTATITGGDTTNALYQFQVKQSGGSWQTVRDFAPENQCIWTPSTIGSYDIRVLARNNIQAEDATATITAFTAVDFLEQQGVTLTTDMTPSQEYNIPITLSATPTGDAELSERAEYRYAYQYESTWHDIQGWTDSNTCTWTSSSKGTYNLRVYTRTKGRTCEYDTYADVSCTFADIAEQTSVTLSPDKLPEQKAGTSITLTAQASVDNPALASRAEYRFTYTLGTTTKVIRDWSSESTCTWIPEAKGTYTLHVYTRTQGRSDYDANNTYEYTVDIEPLTNVTLTANQSSPQEAGTEILLEAAAEGRYAAYAEYLFRVKDGDEWFTLQDWSTESTCSWTPLEESMYTIEVQARAAGRSETDQTAVMENYYIYGGSLPLTSVGISIPEEYASPQEYNTDIQIHAQATGSSADGTEEYQMRITLDNQPSSTLWSTAKDFTWRPSQPGIYTIDILARAAGRSEYDVIHSEEYTITDIPKQLGVELTSDITTQQEFSKPITLTATPQGGEQIASRAEYRFLYKRGLALTWTEIVPFGDSNTIEWIPEQDGNYTVQVQTRTKGRSDYDTSADTECAVLDIPKQSGVTLTTDLASMQEPGTTITLMAETTTEDKAIAARAEYQFQSLQGKTWTILKDWSTENTCEWTPEKGEYTLRVYARTSGRLTYDKYAEIKDYEIDIIPLTGVSLIGSPHSPVMPETKVTFTATAEGVNANKAEYRFSFYNGTQWFKKPWSTSNTFTEKPSNKTTYKFKVEVRALGRDGVDKSATILYQVGSNKQYTYSVSTMAMLQDQYGGAVKSEGGKWVDASQSDILRYVNPNNWMDGKYKYQFLSLNYISGITASDLDAIISDNSQKGGVLKGKGSVFLAAAKKYDINPAYLVSHAMLETGNGTSKLAKGIAVNGKTVYNVFGICAYDSNPDYYGSKYAYEQNWSSVDAAITGGTAWVSKNYINRSGGAQNTLYSMRWNPNAIQQQIDSGDRTPRPTHQYATDIAWAVKQVDKLKSLMDRCVGAVLEFFIPDYK